MQKAESRHGQTQHPPAAKQTNSALVASPQDEHIAQLETTMDSSPRQIAQRKLFDAIHNSPLQTAQRKKFDSLFGAAQRREEEDTRQGKFETAQLNEKEEPLQPRLASGSAAQLEQQPATKPNDTGLPDSLKSGIENLSGMSMDNVKVHYNSPQPAQLNAHAYAQGTDIHVAPGQEQHLPHEAWHVVQQAQGRVPPTMQMKEGVPVNDDKGLEHEADVMGEQAIQGQTINSPPLSRYSTPVQLITSSSSFNRVDVIQPVWIHYDAGSILMWDKKLHGIRWYYLVKDNKMYYQIEGPDDLARTLGFQIKEVDDLSDNPPPDPMKKYRDLQGMENSLSRDDWMNTGLFGQEDHEPEPAPVIKIEELSTQITKTLQPQALNEIQSVVSSISSSSLQQAPVEHTPLFDILNGAAKKLNMSIWEMELRLGSPAVYYDAFKADQKNAGKQMGISFSDVNVGGMKTFEEYIQYLTLGKKLTGSCGQTSSWLHRITGGLMGMDGGQETPLPVKDFLTVLRTHKNRPFYMRVLTGGHSFIIESSGSKMAIYQSWHGSAPMAFMLEKGLQKRTPDDMISLLTKVLAPKDSMIGKDSAREQASSDLFYGQDHKDPTPLVWFNINLNPLSPDQIQRNIISSVEAHSNQWAYAIKGGDMEKMNIKESPDNLGRETPPNDMAGLLEEHGLHTDLHKGLTYLHQEQRELATSKVTNTPVAEESYTFKSSNWMPIKEAFTIGPEHIEGGSPSSSSQQWLMMAIIKGQLKTDSTYKHTANKMNYSLAKTGSGTAWNYTFTKIK